MRPPQRRPAVGADTVRAAQEFTVTAETACPQVDVHEDTAGAFALSHSHMSTSWQRTLPKLPVTFGGRIAGKTSKPLDPQNVLGFTAKPVSGVSDYHLLSHLSKSKVNANY